jgi:hypothetical protein
MATALDFIRASVQAYKHSLDQKSSQDKDGPVSIQIAQQFNSIVDQIKKEVPEAASHLPQPITWTGPFARMNCADVKFLELEMMLNQVLAILEVVQCRQ